MFLFIIHNFISSLAYLEECRRYNPIWQSKKLIFGHIQPPPPPSSRRIAFGLDTNIYLFIYKMYLFRYRRTAS